MIADGGSPDARAFARDVHGGAGEVELGVAGDDVADLGPVEEIMGGVNGDGRESQEGGRDEVEYPIDIGDRRIRVEARD